MPAKARLHEEGKGGLMVRDSDDLLARQACVPNIPVGYAPVQAADIVGGVHLLDAVEEAAKKSRWGPGGNGECVDLRGHRQNSLAI
jgi:hypothetical protein